MKNVRVLDDYTVLTVLRDYVDPEHLRPRIEAQTRLAGFLEDFEALLRAFRTRIDEMAVRDDGARNQLKQTQSEAELRHDANVRQQWHTLKSAMNGLDRDVAREATRLTRVIFPQGRFFMRSTPYRKIVEAAGVEERLTEEDKQAMTHIRATEGTVAELHEERMHLAETLNDVYLQLRETVRGPSQDVRVIRTRWVRTFRLFWQTTQHIGIDPDDERALFGHVEALIVRALARASAAAGGGQDSVGVGNPQGGGSSEDAGVGDPQAGRDLEDVGVGDLQASGELVSAGVDAPQADATPEAANDGGEGDPPTSLDAGSTDAVSSATSQATSTTSTA